MKKYKYKTKKTLCFHPGRSRRGAIVLMTAFFFSIILGALAFNVLRMARYQTLDRGRYEIYKNEFAAAEAALNQIFGHVQFLVRHDTPSLRSEILDTPAPVVEGFDVRDWDVELVSDATEEVTSG
ncbi:MAG: hypothetical protein ACOCVL_02215, partial [Candidatus Sumerlaeota bacterium]